ncbi:MAG: Guanine nucleotide exchange factor lte1 [Watsoniomyces obsoletus]|nr:MAG: Guanine nucleotide exchange factor lte1 [Watsoniomyces obsoletus]
MAFLFGRNKQKSSADMARLARELIPKIDGGPGQQKQTEELVKLLAQMKLVLQGTHESESSPEQVSQLVMGIIQEEVLLALARVIQKLPFESRKDVQVIFSYVFRFKPLNAPETVDPLALSFVINHRPEVVTTICRGYDRKESALPCGTVLREILKHEAITSIILYDEPNLNVGGGGGGSGGVGGGVGAGGMSKGRVLPTINPSIPQTGEGVFWRFFHWIENGTFEVNADAFTTFRDLLTKHKSLLSNYLYINFDLFFDKYNSILVQSESYVTKRQSIKLLGEILLDRSNYEVMMAYVDRGSNLKLCMNLLKDERKMVQYEGFHVFKIFVANPHKSPDVQRILVNNRDKLARFLQGFLDDRTDDEQFIDEKNFLLKQIRLMPSPTFPSASVSASASGLSNSGSSSTAVASPLSPTGSSSGTAFSTAGGAGAGEGRMEDAGDDGETAEVKVGRGSIPSIIEPDMSTGGGYR